MTRVAHEVRELDRGRDRDDVLEHAEDPLAERHCEQVVATALLARTLQALLEAHVEQLENHEVVLDPLAHHRRDEPRAIAFTGAEQLDDVRVTLDALQDLLLHLEPHLVLARHAALQALDRDRPAQRGLALDPALLAEVGLREPARAELDRLTGLVDHERVDPAARDVGRGLRDHARDLAHGRPGHLLHDAWGLHHRPRIRRVRDPVLLLRRLMLKRRRTELRRLRRLRVHLARVRARRALRLRLHGRRRDLVDVGLIALEVLVVVVSLDGLHRRGVLARRWARGRAGWRGVSHGRGGWRLPASYRCLGDRTSPSVDEVCVGSGPEVE